MRIRWAATEPDWYGTPRNLNGHKTTFEIFADELRQQPGQWARYPGTYVRKLSTARNIAYQISTGRRNTFPKGEFEARMDSHYVVWVRAVKKGRKK